MGQTLAETPPRRLTSPRCPTMPHYLPLQSHCENVFNTQKRPFTVKTEQMEKRSKLQIEAEWAPLAASDQADCYNTPSSFTDPSNVPIDLHRLLLTIDVLCSPIQISKTASPELMIDSPHHATSAILPW